MPAGRGNEPQRRPPRRTAEGHAALGGQHDQKECSREYFHDLRLATEQVARHQTKPARTRLARLDPALARDLAVGHHAAVAQPEHGNQAAAYVTLWKLRITNRQLCEQVGPPDDAPKAETTDATDAADANARCHVMLCGKPEAQMLALAEHVNRSVSDEGKASPRLSVISHSSSTRPASCLERGRTRSS
jgi:hypothetical protein